MEALPLLYHPATALFVDSNGSFLRSLALHLDQRKRAYVLCTHPMDALAILRARDAAETSVNRLWVNRTRRFGGGGARVLAGAKQQNMEQELHRTIRFGNIFAVVVEHEMPALSGLQLCKRVENPFVQKILLTSCADEELLQKALRQGLAHAVVFKHDPCVLQRLTEALRRAQERYFALVSAAYALASGLELEETAFLTDRALRDFFAQLCQRLDIVGHHPLRGFVAKGSDKSKRFEGTTSLSVPTSSVDLDVAGGGDFVLLDREGIPYGLCVRTKEQVDIIAESRQWAEAGEQVREDIRKRRAMLCLPQTSRHFPHDAAWQSCVRPAQVVRGRDETYYCACAKGLFGLPQEHMAGFTSYPDKLVFHDHVPQITGFDGWSDVGQWR
ncbi:MAG: hypothetical protein AAF471_00300 [Myxococcota bacterium]